jgi:hypothetical protein
MANTFLTIGMVTREALRVLTNNLVTGRFINREYDDQYGRSGAKIGTTLNIRKPVRYVRTDGQGLQLQDVTETQVPLVLTTQAQRALAATSQDFALSIDDFSKRFITPAVDSIANQVDQDILSAMLYGGFNEVGTPGTVPNALLTYLDAGVALDYQAAPRDKSRSVVLGPQGQATIVDSLKGLFQASDKISEQYDTGTMGTTIGMKWSMDQNVPTFTTGATGGNPIVSANQTGSSIATTGWTASTKVLNRGDVIQFAGCYSVNPQSRQSTGVLANWLVMADVTSDGSGNATIQISGPSGYGIIVAGPFQTASAVPTTSGAVTISGGQAATTSPRFFAFHRDAITMACADLPLWEGTAKSERVSDKEMGLSIRLIQAYDINLDRAVTRCDFLYGIGVIYPELLCRIAS